MVGLSTPAHAPTTRPHALAGTAHLGAADFGICCCGFWNELPPLIPHHTGPGGRHVVPHRQLLQEAGGGRVRQKQGHPQKPQPPLPRRPPAHPVDGRPLGGWAVLVALADGPRGGGRSVCMHASGDEVGSGARAWIDEGDLARGWSRGCNCAREGMWRKGGWAVFIERQEGWRQRGVSAGLVD